MNVKVTHVADGNLPWKVSTILKGDGIEVTGAGITPEAAIAGLVRAVVCALWRNEFDEEIPNESLKSLGL